MDIDDSKYKGAHGRWRYQEQWTPLSISVCIFFHFIERMCISQRHAELHEKVQRRYGCVSPITKSELADHCANINLEYGQEDNVAKHVSPLASGVVAENKMGILLWTLVEPFVRNSIDITISGGRTTALFYE